MFVLWHVRTFDDGDDDEKLIGIYSTEERAVEARKRAVTLPGFREHPEGFEIHPYQLDRDGWTEGFVTRRRESRTQPI